MSELQLNNSFYSSSLSSSERSCRLPSRIVSNLGVVLLQMELYRRLAFLHNVLASTFCSFFPYSPFVSVVLRFVMTARICQMLTIIVEAPNHSLRWHSALRILPSVEGFRRQQSGYTASLEVDPVRWRVQSSSHKKKSAVVTLHRLLNHVQPLPSKGPQEKCVHDSHCEAGLKRLCRARAEAVECPTR